jgi:threonine dehydrogenase-like Zn-dependent dehydrogenase
MRRAASGKMHGRGDDRGRRTIRRCRAYIEELLPDILEGGIEPGRVFDRVTNLDGVPDGYRAMNEREAIKVLIKF